VEQSQRVFVIAAHGSGGQIRHYLLEKRNSYSGLRRTKLFLALSAFNQVVEDLTVFDFSPVFFRHTKAGLPPTLSHKIYGLSALEVIQQPASARFDL